MANFADWNKNVPTGNSFIRDLDDTYRSDKSILEAALDSEHDFNSSASTRAGRHKLGSARVYFGPSSQVSSTGENGRLMWNSTASTLHVLNATSTATVATFNPANELELANLAGLRGYTASATTTIRIARINSNDAVDLGQSTNVVTVAGAISTGASGGDVVMNNAAKLRAVNASTTTALALIGLDASNVVRIGDNNVSGYFVGITSQAAATLPGVASALKGLIVVDETNNALVFYTPTGRYRVTGTSF